MEVTRATCNGEVTVAFLTPNTQVKPALYCTPRWHWNFFIEPPIWIKLYP